MTPRSNRVLLAIVLAALWTGSLWWAVLLDLQTIAVTVGAIAGRLIYWLLDRFSQRFRGWTKLPGGVERAILRR